MDNSIKMPFYAKMALISISIFTFIYTLYIAQDIIIPIVYATLIAILLNPLVDFLIGKKINKIIAISMVLALTIFILVGILYLVYSRLDMFSETYPQLKDKFNATSNELVQWISKNFKIRQFKINAWVKETQGDVISNFALFEKLTEVGRILMIGILLPVYLFMILYYKPLLLEFVRKLFSSEHQLAVAEVLTNSKGIVQSYLMGLFFEMLIVAVLNSVGLFLIGIDYAIILGILGAILNIIPYVGGVVSTALPMLIAYLTKDSLSYPFVVLLTYLFIQFIDNNYIVPSIVASRVQINALISVIVVLIGGALWGVSGMFLSIPLTAILKVIFDHVEPLKPWGFLLGNIVPTTSKFSFIKRTKK